ncbi:hypothetical protein [Youngiibacter fragilis]|uniref:hypothetical protein n=1 Tax=Youngiibacter fragilis TaxID=1408819 RepID=UPI001395DB20|nr:hypothetical protein [Youngiibacter fragilis]
MPRGKGSSPEWNDIAMAQITIKQMGWSHLVLKADYFSLAADGTEFSAGVHPGETGL